MKNNTQKFNSIKLEQQSGLSFRVQSYLKKLVIVLCLAPLAGLSQQQKVNLIPQPISLDYQSGKFTLSANTAIQFQAPQKEAKEAAEYLQAQLKATTGLALAYNSAKPSTIQLSVEKIASIGDEGYNLVVTPQKITIKANSKAGLIHGIQTLLQTVPSTRSVVKHDIPCMTITDYPRFKYRGMHLDVGRHFYPVSFVKKYIDFLAAYKFNYFHWHLTEDQGWRIEIKKYPELTTKGGYRNGTIIGRYPGTANTNLRYGGFYTQEEVKDIVAYAAQRSITVVPEIELPGHGSAAIYAYPWLSCFPEKPTHMPNNAAAVTKMLQSQGDIKMVQETWGVFDDIFCAGKDSTFMFLQDVLDEVLQLFPSKFIHIGGDEAPKKHWEQCPRCQARMKAEGLKDEHHLQSYFIQRIEKYLNAKNRTIIGWDEILEGGLAPNAMVMSWRGEAGGIEAAKQNHYVIMTPGSPVYFDHHQGDPATEPIGIGGFNTLKHVYDYEPIPKELPVEQSKYVMGAQANLWTEYIPTTQHAEYMVLPRMVALSEVLWSQKESKNWNDFSNRLQPHFTTYEQRGWNYSRGNYKVDVKSKTENGQMFAVLATEILNGEIVYTTDGSDPKVTSKKYTDPIPVTPPTTIKAAVVVNGRIMSPLPTQQVLEVKK